MRTFISLAKGSANISAPQSDFYNLMREFVHVIVTNQYWECYFPSFGYSYLSKIIADKHCKLGTF